VLFAQLLTGFGLAGAAGLNAYIPLLAIALLGRFGVVTLHAPFDVLTHGAVIAVLAVLLVVELVVDKVPVVNVSSAGFGAPVVSLLEDITSVLVSLAAIFAPIVVLGVMVVMAWAGVKVWRRVRRRRAV
jgi:hypothetical protein